MAHCSHAGETVLMDAAIEPEVVADALCAAMPDGRFLVLPHPEVRDYCREQGVLIASDVELIRSQE